MASRPVCRSPRIATKSAPALNGSPKAAPSARFQACSGLTPDRYVEIVTTAALTALASPLSEQASPSP